MTKREQLIKDALEAGYELSENGRIIGKFRYGTGTCLYGLVMCEDGTYYRADVTLDLTVTIRTHKLAREILGLSK